MSQFAVISCIFNAVGFSRPRDNLLRFVESLENSGCPYYLIELALPGQDFCTPSADNVLRFRSRTVLWHKEKLLNLLAAKLPQRIRKIAWLDADVVFPDPDWWKQTVDLLDRYIVVQPFETAEWLDRNGDAVERRANGYVMGCCVQPPGWAPRRFRHYHPGFAWAARREFFARGGLFTYHLVGGGDAVLALSLINRLDRLAYVRRYNPDLFRLIKEYARSIRWIRGKIGYLPGTTIRHLWHGSISNRSYIERKHLLKSYDPMKDIAEDVNGIWRWASEKPHLHQSIARYFLNRREDG